MNAAPTVRSVGVPLDSGKGGRKEADGLLAKDLEVDGGEEEECERQTDEEDDPVSRLAP